MSKRPALKARAAARSRELLSSQSPRRYTASQPSLHPQVKAARDELDGHVKDSKQYQQLQQMLKKKNDEARGRVAARDKERKRHGLGSSGAALRGMSLQVTQRSHVAGGSRTAKLWGPAAHDRHGTRVWGLGEEPKQAVAGKPAYGWGACA